MNSSVLPLRNSLWLAALCQLFMAGSLQGFAESRLPFTAEFPIEGVTYSTVVPTPGEVIGHVIGERHTEAHQVVNYFKAVASASPRVRIAEHGRTYENRPLIHAIVSAAENQAVLEKIRSANLKLSDAPERVTEQEIQKLPAVLLMSYSIHGNEASGTEAAMLLLYHLAAGEGVRIDAMLRDLIVVIDPCQNPDGRNRFVTWVTANRGGIPNPDINDREHNEPWPGGRGNHYFFDMNRDWLPAQLVETQARLELFHHWKPQLFTDFHEMGSESTFFFQPGVEKRVNPLTPARNLKLTDEIGHFHAAALDRIKSLYFTREQFDDFYYGKGSTYPDINGSVGILFEQASARSLERTVHGGVLRYDATIRNQFACSLSSLDAAVALRVELLVNQRDFYLEASRLAAEEPVKAYVLSSEDRGRMDAFLQLLKHHRIAAHSLKKDITIQSRSFNASNSFIVPLRQPQFRLVKTIMERATSFDDAVFYDISTWTLPLAFGMRYSELTEDPARYLGEAIDGLPPNQSPPQPARAGYAYLLEWGQLGSGRALYQLQRKGVKVRVLREPSSFEVEGQKLSPPVPTIAVPVTQPDVSPELLYQSLKEIASKQGIGVWPLSSGKALVGPDLGSPSALSLDMPRIGLISGPGTTSSQVGETWFQLNENLGIAASLLDAERIEKIDLSLYNTLIVTAASSQLLDDTAVSRLKEWLDRGGLLVTWESGVNWVIEKELVDEAIRKPEAKPLAMGYAEARRYRESQQPAGVILTTRVDTTHPIALGLPSEVAFFRNAALILEPSKTPGANVCLYGDDPLLSGYIPSSQLEVLKGSAAVIARQVGAGRVILFANNPNFRAFWFGTSALFVNALFFGRYF